MMEQSGVKISKKRAGDSLEDSGSPPVPGPPLQRPPLQRLPVQLAATVFTVLAATALIAVAAGCGPSVDAVVKMRETLPPATGTRGTVGANLVFAQDKQRLKAETRARENLAGLMERFERPHSDECWRAEAMTSMLAIEQWLQCPQKDRATHSRFKALLKAEYQAPRLKNGDGSDGGVCDAFYQLRAWGVYTLGKLDDPDLDEFFISVLASDIDAGRIDWAAEFAAFDSLSRRTAGISANVALRNRLLALLLRLNILLDKTRSGVTPAARAQMQHYILVFERQLKNYDAIVDLLPSTGQKVSDEEIMVYLGWNYQYLALGKHREQGADELFARNVSTLLSLAWHGTAQVRTRARVVLAGFAPVELFVQAAQGLGTSTMLTEDCELLANLLPACDTAGKQDDSYRQSRAQAFERMFGILGNIPPQTREIVYARLLAQDPALLCERLLAVNARVLDEGPNQILQQIRYLRHLRCVAADGIRPWSAKLAPAIALFARSRIPAAREQVVAELLDGEPRVLADALAPQLDLIRQETADQARYLAGAFAAALESMEKQGVSPAPPNGAGTHLFEHFAPVLERPELDNARTAIDFLSPRDPDRLVAIITRQVEQQAPGQGKPAAVRYAMLGDLLQSLRAKLDPASAAAAVHAVSTGVRSGDEDVVLLCCRYLVELQADPELWKGVALPDSARVLLDLAGRQAPQGGRP